MINVYLKKNEEITLAKSFSEEEKTNAWIYILCFEKYLKDKNYSDCKIVCNELGMRA